MEQKVTDPPSILVVEDDPDLGPKLLSVLEQLTKPILALHCIDDAVDALKSAHYDLLVIDIWIPKTKEKLQKKREFEALHDEISKKLQADNCKEDYKRDLRRAARDLTVSSRQTLERRGGLMVLEQLRVDEMPGAVMFLTAIGNTEMRDDAKATAAKQQCTTYEYLVKPQPPETITSRGRSLLGIK